MTDYAIRPGIWLPPRRLRLSALPRVEIGVPKQLFRDLFPWACMSKTDYEEVEVLKNETGQTNALGTARTPWMALYTTAPSDSSAGTEVATGAYARSNSSGKWATPSAGSVANNAVIAFPQATAGYTVVGMALADATSSGNLLRWSTVTSKTIATNDIPQFAVSAVTFTED